MNQELIPVYGLIGILAVLIVKVYNTAFKGGKFTCNRYILNTYLYILLALVIISLQNITFRDAINSMMKESLKKSGKISPKIKNNAAIL